MGGKQSDLMQLAEIRRRPYPDYLPGFEYHNGVTEEMALNALQQSYETSLARGSGDPNVSHVGVTDEPVEAVPGTSIETSEEPENLEEVADVGSQEVIEINDDGTETNATEVKPSKRFFFKQNHMKLMKSNQFVLFLTESFQSVTEENALQHAYGTSEVCESGESNIIHVGVTVEPVTDEDIIEIVDSGTETPTVYG